MEIKTEEMPQGDGLVVADEDHRERAREAAWYGAGVLWRRRRFLIGFTGLAAVLAVVVALLLPRWYVAEARVLRSEGGMSLMNLADRATGGLSRLLGGGGGDYVRYLAILTSRSMMEDVIERFDLVRAYEFEDSKEPMEKTIALLSKNVEFEVDAEFDFLAVRAYDQDPEQAASMANFLVARLNQEQARLSSQSAREGRVFIEQRLHQAEADLDSVRAALQAFQETNGLVEIESQAQAFMTSMAEMRGRVAELEVQYQMLAQQYGPDNPQVQAARSAVRAARDQVSQSFGGQDELLPVSMRDLPAITRRYAELMQEQLIQAKVIEEIYPLYEQALFQEKSDASAVQVVDAAIPPSRAARPSKRVIVLITVFSAFLLATVYVLLKAWLDRNYQTIARRLDEAASS